MQPPAQEADRPIHMHSHTRASRQLDRSKTGTVQSISALAQSHQWTTIIIKCRYRQTTQEERARLAEPAHPTGRVETTTPDTPHTSLAFSTPPESNRIDTPALRVASLACAAPAGIRRGCGGSTAASGSRRRADDAAPATTARNMIAWLMSAAGRSIDRRKEDPVNVEARIE